MLVQLPALFLMFHLFDQTVGDRGRFQLLPALAVSMFRFFGGFVYHRKDLDHVAVIVAQPFNLLDHFVEVAPDGTEPLLAFCHKFTDLPNFY